MQFKNIEQQQIEQQRLEQLREQQRLEQLRVEQVKMRTEAENNNFCEEAKETPKSIEQVQNTNMNNPYQQIQ